MSPNARGILAITAAAAGFLLNDATMKFVTDAVPPGQALFVRGVFACILIAAVMRASGEILSPRELVAPSVVIRSLAATGSAVFIILSLQKLPLATVNAVLQVTPLVVMAGASLFLGERIDWRRWVTAATGFTGVLLIIRPGRDALESGAALTLVALCFTAARDLATRWTPPQTSALAVALAGSIAVAAGGLTLSRVEAWVKLDVPQSGLLLLASLFITIAYVAGVIAMRTGEISVVAPFRYVQMPLAVLLGYLIWRHTPDMTAAIGMAMVAGAGLYILYREHRYGATTPTQGATP